MYIKKLNIKNFRCFEDYSIEFAPHTTVLFGKNGSGKTTLIHALHKALSFIMFSDKIYEKNQKTNKKELKETRSIIKVVPNLTVENYHEGDFYDSGKDLIEIIASASIENIALDWKMSAFARKLKPRPNGYIDAFRAFYQWHKDTDRLPLLAYYSDGFPHSEDRRKINEKISSARDFAYYDWNAEEACSKAWIERLESKLWKLTSLRKLVHNHKDFLAYALLQYPSQWEQRNDTKIVKEVSYDPRELINLVDKNSTLHGYLNEMIEVLEELDAVVSCLKEFSSGLENFEIDSFDLDGKDLTLCLNLINNQTIAFRSLPAGYKRMYYMALDIAYRSFLLNGTTDAFGIVIIDEIDLHLHPELEQSILERFMCAFPHIQFIVSTHSPLVLTGIETLEGKNKVMKMSPHTSAPEEWRNIHGIDYNLMLEENMDVMKRKPEIQLMFDKAWRLVGEHNIVDARMILAELERRTPSDQIEIVKLRTLIDRLELIGK